MHSLIRETLLLPKACAPPPALPPCLDGVWVQRHLEGLPDTHPIKLMFGRKLDLWKSLITALTEGKAFKRTLRLPTHIERLQHQKSLLPKRQLGQVKQRQRSPQLSSFRKSSFMARVLIVALTELLSTHES